MIEKKYPHLFAPLRLGNVVYKNRIFAAPTGCGWGLTGDGQLTPEAIAFFESKAKGGAAVVTMGECIVDSLTGKSHDKIFALDSADSLISLTKFARAVKRHGAVPSAELAHGGKWGGLVSIGGLNKAGKVAYGPSEEDSSAGRVLEMPKDMILEIVGKFAKGAGMLKRAGVEMCMVHAGHGWLFSQFLSPAINHRRDEFGGSLTNRARFLIMTLEAIRKEVGPGFPIEVRISGDEFVEGGVNLEESIELAKLIQNKCDLINVSAGIHEDLNTFVRMHPSQYLPKGPNVYLAEAVKREVDVAISTVGGIVDPELMEDILASGKADVILLGRPLVADPELPNKIMLGREREIVHCLRCNGCFGESQQTGVHACALNPVYTNVLNDRQARAILPAQSRHVMVVGGGPGGMKAAITAAERGHKVVLYEKADRLGGALNLAEHIDFKRGLYDFKETLEYMIQKNNVRVVLNTPVTREVVEKEQPEVLLVAAGADAVIPRIPGIDDKKVLHAEAVLVHPELAGEKVAVIGGGLVGSEAAAYLGRLGKHVTVVEMKPEIAWDDSTFGRAAVVADLHKNQVRMLTKTSAVEINQDGLVVRRDDGSLETIEADTIINAAGRRPNQNVFLELANSAPIVQMIGDCRKVGKVMYAVSDGYYMALDI